MGIHFKARLKGTKGNRKTISLSQSQLMCEGTIATYEGLLVIYTVKESAWVTIV